MPVTSHGPLAHLTGVIERVPSDSGVDLPRATLYNGALPCNAGVFQRPPAVVFADPDSAGRFHRRFPVLCSRELFSRKAFSSAWGVSSLETDLVRRPRVRGTAPQATVGNERRRESLF